MAGIKGTQTAHPVRRVRCEDPPAACSGQERAMHARRSGGTFGGRSQLDSRRRAQKTGVGARARVRARRRGPRGGKASGIAVRKRRARVHCISRFAEAAAATPRRRRAVSDRIVQIRARCVQRPASAPRREHARGLERGSASGGSHAYEWAGDSSERARARPDAFACVRGDRRVEPSPAGWGHV